MWGIVLVIMVTKDCECFTTCRTMTNCPFLNENGGSSKHSKRSEYFLYFNVLFKTFKEIFCKELLFFGNFFIFLRFKVLQMMLYILMEMLVSEIVEMDEQEDLNDAYQHVFQ